MKKNGISLITLIITIVVVVILAAAVVLALSQNNPISDSRVAQIVQTRDSITSGILIYTTNVQAKTTGELGLKDILIDSEEYRIVVSDRNTDRTITKDEVEIKLYKLDKERVKDKLNIDLKNENDWYIDEKGFICLAFENENSIPSYIKQNITGMANFVTYDGGTLPVMLSAQENNNSNNDTPVATIEANASVNYSNGVVTNSKYSVASIRNITTSTDLTVESNTAVTESLANGTYEFEITDEKGNTKTVTAEVIVADLIISTLEGLKEFRDSVNNGNNYAGKIILQTADINMNEGKYTYDSATGNITFDGTAEQWVPIGNTSTASKNFAGTYNGLNHKIIGLYINNTSYNYGTGLFGRTRAVNISNLTLYESSIIGGKYVGGIIGQNKSSSCNLENIHIEKSHIEGNSSMVGGIIGSIDSTTDNIAIRYCSNTSTVVGGSYVGGITGDAFIKNDKSAIIEKCYNTGSVTATNAAAAGIIGELRQDNRRYCQIVDCYNTGNITSASYAAGICYTDNGSYYTIARCYNTGNINGRNKHYSWNFCVRR